MGSSRTIGWDTGAPILGTPFREVVTAAEAGGALVVLAAEMPVGLHVDEHCHEDEDQITIVIEGCVGAAIDGEHVRIETGGAIFMPRGVPHTQWNAGDVPAKCLEIYTPPGFEDV